MCAMDVVGDSNPDILQQMQEKGRYEIPPPVEAPPVVTRVGPTSLQVCAANLFFSLAGSCIALFILSTAKRRTLCPGTGI